MDSTDFSWLHLSDFHLGKDDYAQKTILGRILEEVECKISAGRKPDFVFITGDLANKGRTEEFTFFDEQFLIPLMTKLGDDYFDKVFIVPGNHDVDRTKAKSIRRYDVLDEIQTFLDPTKEGLDERELLISRLAGFDCHPWYLEYQKWVSSADGFLTRRISKGSCNIGVLCINTAWFCGKENEKGQLNPGLGMIENGLAELAGCEPIFVLGHHPVDWLVPELQRRFLSLLAKSKAIYLHGHLHKSEYSSQSMGLSPVLCIQTGCAFFARNDEKWVTRLLWGGYCQDSQEVYLLPRKWNQNDTEWAIDSDAFPDSKRVAGSDYWVFPSGKEKPNIAERKRKASSAINAMSMPEGWVRIDSDFLDERRQVLSDDRILQYFEGRSPHWSDILSEGIPERSIVGELVEILLKGFSAHEPTLTLLLGAGGEGKSTAFLQILRNIATNCPVKVLWRHDSEMPLPPTFVSQLYATRDTWLIASDEGDSLIKDTYQSLKSLNPKANIHFLLACRDTDWIENRGREVAWSQVAAYSERQIKGLGEQDALKIVTAWSRLGSRGLGKLADCTIQEAVSQLVEAARVESTTSDGAFLGAMLRVRVGVALRDHVAALMSRLESREIPGMPGVTLLDAFVRIAVPHAFNVLYLSKSVLAKSMGIDESRVRRRVLSPLGEEAAATATGQFILTRHRAIAEVAMEIASNRFDVDPEVILSELVRAAIIANEEGLFVPHFSDWRFLSSRMFEQGNHSLGVLLASTAAATDPRNSYLAVKLAQLYRQAGQAEQSANVFRKSYTNASGNRAFFTEWATCEGFLDNRALAVWISAASIADDTEMRPPDIRDVGFGLAGCLVNFIALCERYQDSIFYDAAKAVDQIARRISLPKGAFDEIELRKEALAELGDNRDLPPSNLLAIFVRGILRAHDQREMEVATHLVKPSEMNFTRLNEFARLNI